MTLAATFLRSDLWPLLLLAPSAWWLLRVADHARARRLRALAGARADAEAAERSPRARRLGRTLFGLALLCSLGAALGPAIGEAAPARAFRGVDLVVCLDVSRSMLARDLRPDRLRHARGQLRDLAEAAPGSRLALVAFAGEARLITPLTHDRPSFAELAALAEPASVPRGGTDLGAALHVALGALRADDERAGAIVLLTDGEDLGGAGLRAARACRAHGVPVYCVGFGSRRGSKIALRSEGASGFLRDRAGADVVSALDAGGLAAIADVTGGGFRDASSEDAALRRLYEGEILPAARSAPARGRGAEPEDRFQWPLLAAVLLWTLGLALTDRRRP